MTDVFASLDETHVSLFDDIEVFVRDGDEIEIELSPVGPPGPRGEKGDKGDTGEKGEKGDTGAQGPKGDTGEQGPKGDKGDTGEQGPKGDKGDPGASAYEVALDNGFEGTEQDWLDSLKGDKGDPGEKGDKGDKGDPGEKGDKGDKGDPGEQGPQGPPGETVSWGTWSPAVVFTTPGDSTFSYSTQVGVYARIGNLVIAWFNIEFTPTIGTGSGSVRLSALPAQIDTDNGSGVIAWVGGGWNIGAGYTHITLTRATSTSLGFRRYSISNGTSNMSTAHLTDNQSHRAEGFVIYKAPSS